MEQVKTRIGILIRDFEALDDYDLRVVDGVFKNPSLELVLLVKDGRRELAAERTSLMSRLKAHHFFGKVLLKIQHAVESKLFPHKPTVDKSGLIKRLREIETIELSPVQKGYLDIFSKEDAEQVSRYNLDIILRHEFGIIKGDILNAAKQGIWSFHHGDNTVNRGGPVAFWEIYLKEPAVGVTLQKLTSELDGGLVIDKGFYNYHWSHYKTVNEVLECSVSILFKNINKLQQGKLTLERSSTYYNPLYRSPGFWQTIKYCFHFYSKLITLLYDRAVYRLFGIRSDCWTLFIGKGPFLESTLYRLKPAELPKDEFWADPFLIEHNNELYVFFEIYEYKTKKGKIACGKIVKGKITGVVDVLVTDYHLSYPFIFKEGGDMFMIPEMGQAKKLIIYKCVQFPGKWEPYSTAFEGESIADTTYHIDDAGQKWLLMSKGGYQKEELHIYKIDSLKLEKIEAHKMNPVIIDARRARNGGPIFKHNGNNYRPSHYNAFTVYGSGLNINQIKKLTLDDYEEETIMTVKANFHKGLFAMHHLHQLGDTFVIDACYKRK